MIRPRVGAKVLVHVTGGQILDWAVADDRRMLLRRDCEKPLNGRIFAVFDERCVTVDCVDACFRAWRMERIPLLQDLDSTVGHGVYAVWPSEPPELDAA